MGNNESLTPEETEATPRMRRVATAIRQSMRNVLDRVQGVRNRVVVPVLTQYFATNESPASLIDGQFVVLGKIVRTETGDNAKPINLLRGTAFGYLPDSSLIDLIHQLEEAFNIPPLEMEIKAPAFQVIPIAIFA